MLLCLHAVLHNALQPVWFIYSTQWPDASTQHSGGLHEEA